MLLNSNVLLHRLQRAWFLLAATAFSHDEKFVSDNQSVLKVVRLLVIPCQFNIVLFLKITFLFQIVFNMIRMFYQLFLALMA